MTLGFVDSGAWIALGVKSDPHYQTARAFYRKIPRGSRLLTTNYVLSETYTWLRYRVDHRAALELRAIVVAAQRIELLDVVWVTPEQHESGWMIFSEYSDQVLSFTDCTSAVVAREVRADYVFSFDSDFSILGFDVRPGS